MGYKYITDNNLYEKQTYMYSEYGGAAFLKEYINSRQNYLKKSFLGGGHEEDEACIFRCDTEKQLRMILAQLKTGDTESETLALLNLYTKSFEVRKRIYTEYDDKWKPIEDSQFQVYEIYLLFADCLIHAYKQTDCLKYLNCLLKVDDTLLSISADLKPVLMTYLAWIVDMELKAVFELVDKMSISLEVKS